METKFIFLDLTAKNDGKWTWYQLERGLNARGIGGQVDTIEEVRKLVKEGLITERKDDKYPHPLYFITDEGRHILKSYS